MSRYVLFYAHKKTNEANMFSLSWLHSLCGAYYFMVIFVSDRSNVLFVARVV